MDNIGFLRKMQVAIFGTRPHKLIERDDKLPWFVQILIYVTSVATLYVFGAQNIISIAHYGISPVSLLFILLLTLLFLMIFSADRSYAATIPRIPVLAQRRQFGMLVEHVAYAACYSVILIATYAIVIFHAETHVSFLVSGRPLIPDQFFLLILFTRAVMQVWTIAHGYLIARPLEVQWSTFERTGAALLGGSITQRIASVDMDNLTLGEQLRLFHLLIEPPDPVSGLWQIWRHDLQAQRRKIEQARRNAVVAAFDAITKRTPTFEQNDQQQFEPVIDLVPSIENRYDAVEARARSVWRDGMSVGNLIKLAGVSRSTASKYVRLFNSERKSAVHTSPPLVGEV